MLIRREQWNALPPAARAVVVAIHLAGLAAILGILWLATRFYAAMTAG